MTYQSTPILFKIDHH